LEHLEAEAIYVLREVAAKFENPVVLFSGGKDSICVAHLAKKAFWPARIPFPLMHVDTGHNFPETLVFRDAFAAALGARLVVASVQDSIDRGRVKEEPGPNASRNALQTVTLLDALNEIARIRLRVSSPVFCDDYARNRITGSLVLVDPFTNETVAGGVIRTTE
jgi:sulfate adenylyltransferase subunit 2